MDPKTLKANLEARAHATAELRALAEAAAGREMTGEELQKEERLLAAIQDYDARVRNGLEAMERSAQADEARAKFESLEGRQENGGQAVASDVDALRALARGERRAVEFLPTAEELRALSVGTNGQGGVTQQTLYAALYEEAKDYSTIMASNARVLRTSSGEDITIPLVTGHSRATIVGEAQPIPASDPTFGTGTTLKAYKYAWLTDISSELMADEAFDLVGWLAQDGGVQMGDGIGIHLVTGSGTGQPQGLFTGANVGVTLASKTAISGDEVISLYHSVRQAYRGRGVFIANDTTMGALRKLKNTNGDYIFQESLRVGAPDTLLGKPVMTDPAVPALDGTVSVKSLGFGDVSRAYTVRFAGALRVEKSTDFRFNTDQTTFRFIQRADGRVVDANAFKVAQAPAV